MTAKANVARVLAVFLFALFAAATLLWIWLDHVPPNWDDAWYLTKSLTAYDALMSQGLAGYFTSLSAAFGFKAPLIAALPTPFYLVFGRRWHAAYLVNIFAMLVLFAAVYRIAWRWWSARAALIAIAVAGTMPLLYGLERWYLVEYSMTALVAVAIAVLIEPDALDRQAGALVLGVLCGLGLLLKAAFVLFLLPPLLWQWAGSCRRVRALVLGAIPCLLIAMPWYAGHWRPVLANALDAGFGLPASVQGTGPIFSISTIVAYLALVARNGLSIYYAMVAVVLAVFAATQSKMRVPRLLLVWFLPFLIFLFGGNKDVRYIAPLLPAAALLIGGLLDAVLPRNVGGVAIASMILAFPFLDMLAVSFGVPWRTTSAGYARRYSTQTWPHDEMLRLLGSRMPRGARPMVLVGSDRAAFNANNVELTAVALRLPLRIETTAHETDLNTLRDRLEQSEFFLYKEGGEPESEVFNPHFAALVPQARTGGGFQEIPYGRPLPDGGVARIFQRSLQPGAGGLPPEEFVIDFGGIVALTSMAVEDSRESVTVRYGWRRLRQTPQEYWSFTHLIDGMGRIVAQLDQPLPSSGANGAVPQRIRVAFPFGVSSASLQLRFGVYDPLTSSRLRIGGMPSSAAGRLQLDGQGTALIAIR